MAPSKYDMINADPGVRSAMAERLWAKTKMGEPSACWEWTGSKTNCGYGIMRVPRSSLNLTVHRLSWSISNGRWPREWKIVCHRCNNKLCVNPAHLYEGTHWDNAKDREEARLAWHASLQNKRSLG